MQAAVDSTQFLLARHSLSELSSALASFVISGRGSVLAYNIPRAPLRFALGYVLIGR